MIHGIARAGGALALAFALAAHAAETSPPPAEPETPCNPADPGFGIYDPWVELNQGRILMPRQGGLTRNNEFDLIIHFHGGNAVRKSVVKSAEGVFVAVVDLGVGSAAYERPFAHPDAFTQLLASIEQAVTAHSQRQARIRKLALSGWSAGYGAIRAILRQQASDRVDSVALIDGLHADYDPADASGLQAEQLRPFVSFAKSTAKDKRFMYVSHSKIIPSGYASTTETAHYLVKMLRGKVTKSVANDGPLLVRYEQAKIDNLLMRGYQGDGKFDHCAEIGLMTRVVATLEKRWKTPAAEAHKPAKQLSARTDWRDRPLARE